MTLLGSSYAGSGPSNSRRCRGSSTTSRALQTSASWTRAAISIGQSWRVHGLSVRVPAPATSGEGHVLVFDGDTRALIEGLNCSGEQEMIATRGDTPDAHAAIASGAEAVSVTHAVADPPPPTGTWPADEDAGDAKVPKAHKIF
jgi:hypothetical protein